MVVSDDSMASRLSSPTETPHGNLLQETPMVLALFFSGVREDDESGWNAKLQISVAVTYGAARARRATKDDEPSD